MNIQELRKKYSPDYDDMSDWELASRFHSAYYSDIDFDEFAKEMGLSESKALRAVGRFGYTIRSLPAMLSATARSFKQQEDPEEQRERLPSSMYRSPPPDKPRLLDPDDSRPYGTRYREWHEKKLVETNATEESYMKFGPPQKKAVDEEAARLVKENGYTDSHAKTEAVISALQKSKATAIESLQIVEDMFALPRRYKERSSGILEDVAGGLATTVISAPAFIIHPVLGYGTTYAMLHGSKVQELEAAGVKDPDAILRSAIISGAIQTPLEAAGNLFMISRVLKTNGTWTSSLVSVAESFGGEALTEFVQQYPDEFATMLALNPKLTPEQLAREFISRIPEISGEAVYAGLVGGLSGGTSATIGITAKQIYEHLIEEPRNTKEFERRKERVERVVRASILDSIREQKAGAPTGAFDVSESEIKKYVNDPASSAITDEQVDKVLVSDTSESEMVDSIMEMIHGREADDGDAGAGIIELRDEPDTPASIGKLGDVRASKIVGETQAVDEDGNAMLVFHGSDNKFKKFEMQRKTKRFTTLTEEDIESQGAFLSPSKEDASTYGKYVNSFYLSVRKLLVNPASMPLSSRSSPAEKARVKEAWDDIEYILEPAIYEEDGKRYIDTDNGISRIEVDAEGNWIDTVMQDDMIDWNHLDNAEVVSRMKERGYDGAKAYDPNDDSGYSWFVTDPDQIIPEEYVNAQLNAATILGGVDSVRFKAWFAASKIVDGNGKPLIVYHGSRDDITEFDPDLGQKHDSGWLGSGFYFTNKPQLADAYSRLKTGPEGRNIMPVFLSIQNPYYATDEDKEALQSQDWPPGSGSDASESFTKDLIEQGYDGVIFDHGTKDGAREYVAFYPTQIKSVYNSGKWDGSDPDVRAQIAMGEVSPGFFSAVERAVEGFKQEKAPAAQWMGMIRKLAVKPEELEWIGIEEWLMSFEGPAKHPTLEEYRDMRAAELVPEGTALSTDQEIAILKQINNEYDELIKKAPKKIQVTKNDILRFVRENNVKLVEVSKGTDADIRDSLHSEDLKDPGYTDGLEWALSVSERGEDSDPIFQLALDDPFLPSSILEHSDGKFEVISDGYSSGVYDTLVEAGEASGIAGRAAGTSFGDDAYRLSGGKQYRELLIMMPSVSGVRAVPHPTNPDAWSLIDKGGTYIRHPRGTGGGLDGEIVRFGSENHAVTVGIPMFDTASYDSGHYSENNVLVHVRFNTRIGPNGEKILFLEEVQSDWHQAGRKEGYKGELPKGYSVKDHGKNIELRYEVIRPNGKPVMLTASKTRQEAIDKSTESDVPPAPFKKTWPLLAFKRMVRYAAENGFDQVAWTPGEVQVERYSEALRAAVDTIEWTKTKDGIQLAGWKDGKQVVDTVEKESAIGDAIGKSMGDSIIANKAQSGTFKGDEIAISDTGMAGFYDKILPAMVNKFFNKKAWGKAKVGTTRIAVTDGAKDQISIERDKYRIGTKDEYQVLRYVGGSGLNIKDEGSFPTRAEAEAHATKLNNEAEFNQEVWTLPITDKMKEKVVYDGMPMFDVGKPTRKNKPENTFREKLVEHTPLEDAVESGLLSQDEYAVISGVMQSFPQAWRDHFDVAFSTQDFFPTKAQLQAHGVPASQASKYRLRGALLTDKIGDLKEDARHVAVIFKGSSVDTFFHEFGEFAFKRLLGSVQSKDFKTVSREYAAAEKAFKKRKGNKHKAFMKKNEWFSDGFRDWWLRNLNGDSSATTVEMQAIFRRVVDAVKAVWRALKAAGKKHPLDSLFEDIIVGRKDLERKYYFSSKEMVLRYIVGAEADAATLGEQGFAGNGKTKISWDPGTICPKKRNLLEYVSGMMSGGKLKDLREIGAHDEIWDELLNPDYWINAYQQAKTDGIDVPCSYCYVEQSRSNAVLEFNRKQNIANVVAAKGKLVNETTPYVDKLLRWSQKKIDEVNARGGLRVFSFGDYVREWHKDNVTLLLGHANKRGLSVKVITKNPEFVEDFAHTGVTINLSVDGGPLGLDGGIPWNVALELKRKHPNVHVRSVAMNLKEYIYQATLEYKGEPLFIDVITPYHHEDLTKPVPAGASNFKVKIGPDGAMVGVGAESKELVAWIEANPRYESKERTCCLLGGKCFSPNHQRQCGTNCGSFAGNLTVPKDARWITRAFKFNRKTGSLPPGMTNSRTLKKHPDFNSAKGGDIKAAAAVVKSFLKKSTIDWAQKRFGEDVTYVPVLAEESTGDNQIPIALASVLAKKTKARINKKIFQANTVQHTSKGMMDRIISPPLFFGHVEKGKSYVLVDDTVTSGGSLSELANHIETNGGKVAGIIVLANASRRGNVSATKKIVESILKKKGFTSESIYEEIGVHPESLTRQEAEYINRFKSFESLAKRARRASDAKSRGDIGIRESDDRRGEDVYPATPASIERRVPPKTQIRKTTGQSLTKEELHSRDDLRAAMKMAVRNAKIAYSSGNKEGVAEGKARIRAIAERAKAAQNLRNEGAKVRKKIAKSLNRTKVKAKSGKPQGKYGPARQAILNSMRSLLSLNQSGALDVLEKNLLENTDDIPPESLAWNNQILDMLSTPLRSVTPEQIKRWNKLLVDIEALKAGGEIEQTLKKANRMSRLLVARDSMVEVMGGIPDGIDSVGEQAVTDETLKARIKKSMIGGMTSKFLGWKDILDVLSYFDEGSSPGKSIISEFGDVLDEKNAEKAGGMEAIESLQEMVGRAFNIQNNRQLVKKMAQDSVLHSLGEFETLSGTIVELKMTRAQARKRLMELMDPSLHDTFFTIQGMGWTDEFVEAIGDFVTPEDEAFVAAQLDWYQKYYLKVNKVYSDIFGVDLPKNAFYSPLSREGVNKDDDAGLGEFRREMAMRTSATSAGGLKSRTANVYPIELRNDVEVFMSHVAEMEHFMAWANKIRDMNAVFSDPTVRQVIRIRFGKNIDQVVQNFLRDFARGGAETARNVRGLDKLRSTYTRGVLSVKPTIFIKQLTSVVAFADSMPVGNFSKELIKTIFNMREAAEVLMTSTMMKHRWKSGEIERDIKTMMNSSEYAKLRTQPSFLNMLTVNVKLGDAGAIIWGGYPVYKYHYNRLKEELGHEKAHKQAIRIFESVSETTQQSSDLSEQSYWQRGGSFAKLFTMFKSSPNQYVRKEIGALRNLAAGRITKKQFAKTMAIYHFILPMLFQWVSDRFTWDMEEQARAMTLGSLNGLFIVGDGLDYLLRKTLGLQTYDLGIPLWSIVEDLGKAMALVGWDEMDADDFLRAIRGLAGAIGATTGTPAKQIVDVATGFSNILAGEYEVGIVEIMGWSPYTAKKAAEEK